MSTIKTAWDLTQLYKSHTDPQIEKDIRTTEKAFKAFEKKYRGKKEWLKSDRKLLVALSDYEKLIAQSLLGKVHLYFGLTIETNTSDSIAEAGMSSFSMKNAKLCQHIVFFELDLGKLDAKQQKKFLSSKYLAPYSYLLQRIFIDSKHTLSEAEEKICAMKRLVARDLWVSGVSKALSKKMVTWKGEELPLSVVSETIPQLPVEERRELHKLFTAKLKTVAEFSESEINAVYLNKKIDDELRGYKNPWDSTLASDHTSNKTIDALQKAVEKNRNISHDFFELKRKIFNLDHLEYSDRNIDVPIESSKINFNEAHALFRSILERVHPEFVSIYDSMFENAQVDVFPKQGKVSGAFCTNNPENLPVFVLLNHADTLNSATTLAHEMGHAFHTMFSRTQPFIYRNYSTATAEVASTFFEGIMFEHIYERASEEEKKALLHNRIQDDVQTIFRQMACFSFEKKLHGHIRAKGFAQKEEIAHIMNESMAEYLGPKVQLHPDDGYFFVNWSHIRNFFYVYTYAFGKIVSKALLAEYKKNPKFIEKIITFLKSGGSNTPENIFKSIGVDVTKPDFFERGFALMREDVERLRKLTQK